MTFKFEVDDAFAFKDRSTVFVGSVTLGALQIPARARVLVNGRTIATIALIEERMPGPKRPGSRTVVTRDDVNISAIRAGSCVLESEIGSGDNE
jgi:hypothetical protein